MKKLFKVHVEYTTFVMAENGSEAISIAQYYSSEDLSNTNFEGEDSIVAKEITDIFQVPQEWYVGIPWDSEDDLTVEEILTTI